MKRSGAFVAFGLVALVALAAGAQEAPDYDVKKAFAETDKNHDGAIELDEFHERLVDIFFIGDLDKDGFLTEEEFVAVVVVKEDFATVDKNGDGKASKREFVKQRLTAFIKLDNDDDGSLSLTEVNAALEARPAK